MRKNIARKLAMLLALVVLVTTFGSDYNSIGAHATSEADIQQASTEKYSSLFTENIGDEQNVEQEAPAEEVVEEPVQDEVVQEEPVAEEPAQEEPAQEEPQVQEEVQAEEPVAEEPAQEEVVQEEPQVQEEVQPQTEEAAPAEGQTSEETKTEEAAPAEQTAEETKTEETAPAEEQTAVEPAAENAEEVAPAETPADPEAVEEAPAEEKEEAKEEEEVTVAEEKLVTISYATTEGGSVSVQSEEVDVNAEDAKFNGSTATADEGFKFTNWTDESGKEVETDKTFVPSDAQIVDGAVYTANFEKLEEKLPAQTFEGQAGDASVYVEAPEGAFPENTQMTVTEVKDEAIINEIKDTANDEVDNSEQTAIVVDISFTHDDIEIEPLAPISVKITSSIVSTEEDTQVVHRDDDGNTNVIEATISDDAAEFTSSDFSIYAIVIDPDPTVVTPRRTYKFTDSDRTPYEFFNELGQKVDSQIVKNGDTLAAIEPPYHNGWEFIGWYLVDDASGDYTDTKVELGQKIEDITVDETVELRARYKDHYTITYCDEKGTAIHTDDVESDDGTYKIEWPYTPMSQDSAFLGWKPTKNPDAITVITEGRTSPFENGTEIKVTKSVEFTAYTPKGYWLVFDENAAGASYVGPQFVELGQNTKDPTKYKQDDAGNDIQDQPTWPTRIGYKIEGWYTEAPSERGGEPGGTKFVFGQPLSEKTTLYAKWVPANEADYTVVIWQESLKTNEDGSKVYAYKESLTKRGIVGNDVIIDLNHTDYKADIAGTEKQYIGFDPDHYDTGKKIKAEGNTVVNVYFNRIEYNLQFRIAKIKGSNQLEMYHYENDDRHVKDKFDVSIIPGAVSEGGYYLFKVTKRYGDSISDVWPQYSAFTRMEEVTGLNMISWILMPTAGARTGSGNGGNTVKGVISTMDEMILGDWKNPNGNYLNARYDPDLIYDYTYRIYVEKLPEDTTTPAAQIRTYEGKEYVPYKSGSETAIDESTLGVRSRADFSGQHHPDYPGFEYEKTENEENGREGNVQKRTVYYYYKRLSGVVAYYDGLFVNGHDAEEDGSEAINNTRLLEYEGRGHLYDSDPILYDASVGNSIKDTEKYKNPPSREGFIFDGWFTDEQCQHRFTFTDKNGHDLTMSKDNITVYARWIRKEYRIFLHPDVPTTETTYKDNFEAAGLSASFRVNYGEKIEGIDKVIRDDKKLIGWYTKTVVDGKDVYKPFNIEAYALNDSTAPDTYDKSRSTELDAFGNSTESTNKDTNRRWILNSLDLYARWRDELIGADGINVYYYVENGTKQIYVDETEDVLYADQATATALDIPSEYAEITSEDKIFSHWVVQKYNNTTGKFEDTDTIAKEGHEFGVFKSDAKKTELEGSTQAVPKFSYEVHLKAVYKPKKDDNIKTTKIIYNGNGGTTSLASDESQNCTVNTDKTTVKYDKLQLNTELTITDAGFTRENYELLGWSKYEPNAENVYTVDFKVGDVVGVDELPNKNNTLFGVWKKKEATYIVKYYKDEIDPNDETKNCVGESSKFTAEVGAQIRLVSGDQDGKLNYKKNALDNPDYYLDGVQQNPVPYVMQESTYNQDGTPVPQVIKVLYTRKTATYIVKYYKDEIDSNDETKNYVGEGTPHTAEVGTTIRLVSGDQDSQLNYKKNALDNPDYYLDGVQQGDVPYTMKESTYKEDGTPIPQVIKVLYARKTATYIVKYYKDEIDPNDETKNYVGESDVYPAYVGAEIRLSEGDQDAQLNNKKTRDALNDDPANYLDGVQQNPVPYIMKESTYDEEERPVPQVIKVLYAHKTTSYRIEYYKGEVINDAEHHLTPDVTVTNVKVGTEVNLTTEQLNAKKPAEGYTDGEQLNALIIKENADENVVQVLYRPTEIIVTIQGKQVETFYTGQEQNTNMFPKEGFAENKGYRVVSIKDLAGVDITNLPESEIQLVVEGSDIARGTEANTPANVQYPENYPMGLKGGYNRTDDGCSFECFSELYERIKFVVEDGWLKINPAEDQIVVTITGNTDSVLYNGQDQSVTGYTVDSITLNGETFTGITAEDIALADGAEAKATGKDVKRNAVTRAIENYMMGLVGSEAAQCSFKCTNPNYSNVTFVVRDGYIKINPLQLTVEVIGNRGEEYYDGTEKRVTGYTLNPLSEEVSNGNAGGNQDVARFFDRNKVVFTGEDVAKGILPATYPMGLTTTQFSYEDANIEVTYIVTDGQLIIKDRPDGQKFHVVARTPDRTVQFSGKTWVGSEFDYTVEGTVSGVNTLTRVLNSIGDVIGRVLGIDAHAADAAKEVEINSLKFKVSGLKVDVNARNVGQYDLTIVNEAFKVVDENGNDVTRQFDDPELIFGKLTITPKPIEITSSSASKVYDATPLTSHSVTENTTWGEGDAVTYNYTGSQLNPGTSKNYFTVAPANRLTDFNNYEISLVYGDLTVTDQSNVNPPDNNDPENPNNNTPDEPEKEKEKKNKKKNKKTDTPPTQYDDSNNDNNDSAVNNTTPADQRQVLGAKREQGEQPGVLGARRGGTEDNTNTSRIFVLLIAAGAAATLLALGKKRKKNDEQ